MSRVPQSRYCGEMLIFFNNKPGPGIYQVVTHFPKNYYVNKKIDRVGPIDNRPSTHTILLLALPAVEI